MNVKLYTDGSSLNNGTPEAVAGYGAVLYLEEKDYKKELSGPVDGEQTNNRAELFAAIKGLEAIKQPCTVEIYTDSQVLTQAPGIIRRGFKTSAGKAAANIDLLRQLDKVMMKHDVSFVKVAGHSGDPMNERADALAVAAANAEKARRAEEAAKKSDDKEVISNKETSEPAPVFHWAGKKLFGLEPYVVAPCPACGRRPAAREEDGYFYLESEICGAKEKASTDPANAIISWNKAWMLSTERAIRAKSNADKAKAAAEKAKADAEK